MGFAPSPPSAERLALAPPWRLLALMLASRAAIRSGTFLGSSGGASTTISSPWALRSIISSTCSRYSSRYFSDSNSPDSLDELPDESAEASERELGMARQLIESLASEFDPGKYADTYREQVLEMIERKAQGEEIAVQPAPEEPAKVPDLMAALEASLAAVKETGDGGERKPAAAKRSSSRAKPKAKPAPKRATSKR